MTRVGGYQGAQSVLTRALAHLANQLSPDAFGSEVSFVQDVTEGGITARALFDGVESGGWQIAYMASGYLSARVPALRFLDLPFLVSDRAAALGTLGGQAGALVARDVEAASGLKVLGFWDNGFRHITNGARPIRAPIDCAGLTIRTLDSPIYRATLSALGFTPVFADVRDFVARIASGDIDAQENPLTNIVNFGVHRHHRHVSLTGHVFGVALLVCHRDWHNGLGAVERETLNHAARAATELQHELAAKEDDIALQALDSTGTGVIRSADLDMRAFRAAVEPVWGTVLPEVPAPLRRAWPT